MKVVLNIFNLSDKPEQNAERLLQIFFHVLSDEYNVEMLIKTLFMDWFKFFWLNFFIDLVNLNIKKNANIYCYYNKRKQ